MKIYACGDSAITIVLGDDISKETHYKVMGMKHALDSLNLYGVQEVVPTYASICVLYNPCIITYQHLCNTIQNINPLEYQSFKSHIVQIPVCYDYGLDFERMSRLINLSKEEIIALHSEPTYLVYMLGFMAGFAYLGGLDSRLITPRLDNPRIRIEAGSVGIADKQTGIYPLSSPAGWNVIGRTPLKLYDKDRKEPILLKAGDEIRFQPISKEEFDDIWHSD